MKKCTKNNRVIKEMPRNGKNNYNLSHNFGNFIFQLIVYIYNIKTLPSECDFVLVRNFQMVAFLYNALGKKISINN